MHVAAKPRRSGRGKPAPDGGIARVGVGQEADDLQPCVLERVHQRLRLRIGGRAILEHRMEQQQRDRLLGVEAHRGGERGARQPWSVEAVESRARP